MSTLVPIANTKRRVRLLQLLEAAERAALTPIDTAKLHAFAYLGDVLSQVWNLAPFDQRVLKTTRPPFYPDLQHELDNLVAMGLVEVSDPSYRTVPGGALIFQAHYALRFESSHARAIIATLQDDADAQADQAFLDQLANALASLPDDDIAAAAAEDATYNDPMVLKGDVIEFGRPYRQNRTADATGSFDTLFPGLNLTPARRLYMYAHYLGRKLNAG